MKRIFILFLALLFSLRVEAQVVINEYSCSNMNTVMNSFGDYEDWVELYNTAATTSSISGYYMSDDITDLQKWQVPAGVNISGNSRLMVFCDNRAMYAGGQLHTNFKLTQMKGEYFILSNASGVIVDSVHLIPTQMNHSRGRRLDGAVTWGLFNVPTPNSPNANAKNGYAPTPVFSLAPGFYPGPQLLTITSPNPNDSINYTVDGMTPTITSDTFTGAPIHIDSTMAVRAVAFSNDPLILPSFTETNTYFINENTTMNVFSVCGPYNSLFTGWGGNIVNSIEFFDNNHQFKFELQGTSSPHGNDSWAYPQKGFNLKARDQLGYDWAMKYKFFNTSLRDTFPMVILKAAASDNFPGNSGHPSAHIRDAFVHTLSDRYHLEMDFRNYEPTLVFINGRYWGVYEIRERVDPDYTEYYYNQKEKDVDILQYWGGLTVTYGSDTAFNNLYNFIMANSMAIPANYTYVTDRLNVKSLVQYFILNTWLVDTDWLNWNTMWWRGRKGTGVKWKYALWDEDNVLALGQNYTGMGTVTYQNDPCQPFTMFQNNSSIKHTDILVHLMTNPTFEQLYRSTFIEMLNGPLNCDNMLPHFDSLINIIQPEMQRQCTRWNGNFTTWQANVQFLRDQIVGRCSVIAEKLDSCMDLNPQKISFNVAPAAAGTIQMDGSTVAPLVWSKIIEADTVLNLAATPANSYYFFDHWDKYEVANSFNPDSLASSVAYNFTKKDSVVAVFRYFNPDSIYVSFDVTPPGKGTISLAGNQIASYPSSIKIDRRFPYAISATPISGYQFIKWEKKRSTSNITPTMFSDNASLTFNEADTIIAKFAVVPPTPELPGSTSIPDLHQEIMVPTVFSPNGDGRNDIFRVLGKDIKYIELRIYDRWGTMVYMTNDPKSGWDGNYKGKPVQMGTYYYVLSVAFDNEFLNTAKMYKGEVTLIR